MQRFKELLAEYGKFAVAIHLILYVCTFTTFFIIINLGLKDWLLEQVQVLLGTDEYTVAGPFLLTLAVTKLTQPLRFMILIPLVPFLKQKWDVRKGVEQ